MKHSRVYDWIGSILKKNTKREGLMFVMEKVGKTNTKLVENTTNSEIVLNQIELNFLLDKMDQINKIRPGSFNFMREQ